MRRLLASALLLIQYPPALAAINRTGAANASMMRNHSNASKASFMGAATWTVYAFPLTAMRWE